ncbi:ArsC family reductase [Ferrimonas aestuarii]|uniref:ArsC family reductase n=1 Tax=Ferrimonas aestuarii TaxID=2569539 RepID=A0A4U1BR85_9GAMM|nr:ArsC family reductase [Ferrimonas aestuarii]TKB57567.1 ArsC family reductase [Ferrimonas aestuarii]
MILYGIKNCDSVKKAKKHLEQADIGYQFHDFRQDGLSEAKVDAWLQQVEWKTLLNTRSTSWRQLDDAIKADLDAAKAKALILDNPTLVKRPVLEFGEGQVEVGFKAARYDELFASQT